jgi:peptidoglycan/xylan/chitin deacetylase (PgdA/CDA1 family)
MFGMLLVFITVYKTLIPSLEEIKTPVAPNNGVSITFDDGPHPTHTDQILDILKEKKVHATFFLIGLHVPRYEKGILRELREGHTVGGHSYSHQNFSKLSLPVMAKEVLFTHIKIFSITGKFPSYFRFPYGIDDIRIRNFYS